MLDKYDSYLQEHHPVFFNAVRNHRTHKGVPLDFVNYPYLVDIYMDEEGKDLIKSTQSGLSELLMSLDFTYAQLGKQIFHVLPTDTLVGRFVKNRFDKSVAFSPYYSAIVYDNTKGKKSNEMHLKHIGNGAIAFIGSNSTALFAEYPADILVVDEEDECDQSNLEMAVERLSNSEDRREFRVANPTVLNYGIHARWLRSDQRQWYTKAPCGHWINPHPFKHMLRQVDENEWVIRDERFEWDSGKDINLICDKCGKPFPRFGKGVWSPTYEGRRHGYHINKLFSTKVTLKEIVERFDRGLANDEVMQRVHNSDFGWAYTAEGASISDEALNKCVRDFSLKEFHDSSACVIGADVGKKIHVKVSSIAPGGELRALFIGSVDTEAQFDELFSRYKIVAGVIDAMPEMRMSERLCRKHPGLFRCFYSRSEKSDNINLDTKTITVNRTSAIDNVKESIILQKTLLPANAASLPEYYDHMKSSTRMKKKDQDEYEWVETGPDHLLHASGYELIAKNLLIQLAGR